MSVKDLLDQMLILVLIMAAGIAASKLGAIDAVGNKKLTRLILDVTQPATIIASAVNSRLDLSAGDTLKIFLAGCAMYAVLFALAWLLTPIFGRDRDARGVCRFLTIFGNIGFMGFPVIGALYGSDAILIAAIYIIPFNLLAYSAGVVMLSGGRNSKISWSLMLNPSLIASVIALVLVLFRVHFPYVLGEALDTLGAMTVPGSMLIIGVTLGSTPVKDVFSDWHVYVICLARLILSPLAVYAVCRLLLMRYLSIDPQYIYMLIVLSAMPGAATSTMLCIQCGSDERLSSNGVFLSTLMSIFTVPLMAWLLLP